MTYKIRKGLIEDRRWNDEGQKLVCVGSEDDFLKYIHCHHSFSYSDALKNQGFRIIELPDLRLIAVNETGNYDQAFIDEWEANLGVRPAIYSIYMFDCSRRVHCCELTPSYELWYVEDEFDLPGFEHNGMDEAQNRMIENFSDDVREAGSNNETVKYFHCNGIDLEKTINLNSLYRLKDSDHGVTGYDGDFFDHIIGLTEEQDSDIEDKALTLMIEDAIQGEHEDSSSYEAIEKTKEKVK